MKPLAAILLLVCVAGCVSSGRKGASQVDEYDKVKIEQMTGNDLSGHIFERTVVCLNARRETRSLNFLTNVTVTTLTNQAVVAITNRTISWSTNSLISAMTNLAPIQPGQFVSASVDPGAAAAVETNTVAQATNAGPAFTTNAVSSLAANQSSSVGPSQSVANSQFVRSLNSQLTTTLNNYQVTLATNTLITAETNQVIAYVTNVSLRTLTNTEIVPTNGLVHEYFLYTEYTPPPDFILQPGESLVLLVDGVRYGFAPSPSATGFIGRRGFASNLFRVEPEVLVAIANAGEVKLRLRGVSSLIEKEMNARSRGNFRAFLLKYFSPEMNEESPDAKMASSGSTDGSLDP